MSDRLESEHALDLLLVQSKGLTDRYERRESGFGRINLQFDHKEDRLFRNREDIADDETLLGIPLIGRDHRLQVKMLFADQCPHNRQQIVIRNGKNQQVRFLSGREPLESETGKK